MKILLIVSVIAVLTVDCRRLLQDQPGNSDEATGQDQRGEERTAYGADWAYGQDWTELQDVKEQKSIELRRGRQLHPADTQSNSCLGVIEMKLMSMQGTLSKLESKMNDVEGRIDNTRACPAGFFNVGDQCFKLLTDSGRSWHQAKNKCQKQGLQQAKPNDPVTLRKYIFDNFGDRIVWLGARGDNTAFKWERNGMRLSNSDPSWVPRHPGSLVTTSDCLALLTDPVYLMNIPRRSFFATPCFAEGETNRYALCEP